jgi:hypothetical protein
MNKATNWRRTLQEALLSFGALMILLIVLVATDPRVRDEFKNNVNATRASEEITQTKTQAQVLVHVIKDQSQKHGPLMLMVVAGSMLALFMFRT